MESTLSVEIERHYVILEHGSVIFKIGPDVDGIGLVQVDQIQDGKEFQTTYLTPEAAKALAKVLGEVEVE